VKLLNALIDKFQATFPPNRIVILLTPYVFVPTSAGIAGWITVHFPGLDVPQGAVLGVMGAAALAALTLWYKWLDHWQVREPINVEDDLDQALNQFLADPEAMKALAQLHPELFALDLDPLADVAHRIENLRTKVAGAGQEHLAAELLGLGQDLGKFVDARQAAVAADSSTAPDA
jgi:hypothetical protein